MLRKKTTDGTTKSSALFSAEATANKTARFKQKLKRSHGYCVTIATNHVILEKHAGKSTENRQIGRAVSRVMKIPG